MTTSSAVWAMEGTCGTGAACGVAELQSLLADWQNGKRGPCHTHYELAEPLAHWAELSFKGRFGILWNSRLGPHFLTSKIP